MKKLIEVSNLTKKYGKHEAVKDLSFHVEKGQIYGFLGPNGAGKSTTMNVITGYLCATEGTVTVNGYDTFKEPEKAKAQIGYLPELPPLYPDMTVTEYLKFVAKLKKIAKSERKTMIDEAMELTGITDVSSRLIKNLSKGYKQRVGLAQAILGYPEVIILDEPTVGLDPKQIIEIRDLIKKLGEKHTVILSSHILSEVSAVCDQIMIMSHGQLVANDTPDNLANLLSENHSSELHIKGTPEQLEKVRQTIEDAKLEVSEMKVVHASLEDVFLEVTSDDSSI
ncbi:MAG TPA: ABC transporter ATP-binding protein [Lachnospiraceae bacterium]|nr:ABC transporter ATP-binding protein [Lachnospiraceae bacterium]